MKKMILLAAMTLSSSAFAYVCEVDMVDARTRRIITTIRANDFDNTCREGMKQCRLEIRQRGLHGRADCEKRLDNTPNPYPYPNPQPQPQPNPYPYPDTNPYPGSYEARRTLTTGETAIHNNRTVTVAGVSFQGLYAVRSTDGWSTITNGVSREQLAITSGCSLNLCVAESVINTVTARYVTVAGIHYNENLVTKSTDGWNTLTSNVSRLQLAETEGCIDSRYSRLCVGDKVITTFNRDATVAGIQGDGRVVLKSQDGWNTLTTNVEASSLVVTNSPYPRR